MKKILCIILTIVMLICCFIPSIALAASTKVTLTSATAKSFVKQIDSLFILDSIKDYKTGHSLGFASMGAIASALSKPSAAVSNTTLNSLKKLYPDVAAAIKASSITSILKNNFGAKASIKHPYSEYFEYNSKYKAYIIPTFGGISGYKTLPISCTKSGNSYTMKVVLYISTSDYMMGPFVAMGSKKEFKTEELLKKSAKSLPKYEFKFYKSGSKQYITSIKKVK